MTDPYHGVESKYRLTRGILSVLADEAYPGPISILTKSPLVLRDIDVLRRIQHTEVGVTITTTDDRISRFLEVRAPVASRRLRTLADVASAGLTTYAFVGPLLPHFRYEPHLLDELFGALAHAGVRSVYVEHLNLNSYIRARLWKTLARQRSEVQAVYRGASTDEHRSALDVIVADMLHRHGLRLRRAEVIYHNAQDGRPSTRPGG